MFLFFYLYINYICAMREYRMRFGMVQINLTLLSPFAIFFRRTIFTLIE